MKETNTKILLFISDLGSGGAQRVVCALANHWVTSGRTVSIVTLSDPKEDFFIVPKGVTRETIGLNLPSNSFFSSLIQNLQRIWRLRRILVKFKPTVAIGFIGPSAVLLVAAAIATNIRTIAAERNDPTRQTFGRVWDSLCYLAYRYADRIAVNSTGAFRTLGGKFGLNQIMFTPNPTPSISSGPKLQCDNPIILAVGRLHPQKGVDLLLKAFASLDALEWRLLIVGEGDDRVQLEALAEELGIHRRAIFTGAVRDPGLYYRSASIFALPSRHEGTPNALLEAMCYGLPVVISDSSSGPLDLVGESGAGIVTPCEDVSGLAKALQLLINDSELRERLGGKASNAMEKRRREDQSYQLWDTALDFTK